MAKTYANQDPIKVLTMHCGVINLPRALKQQFVQDVERWYLANGSAFVVERLKFVKQCCVRYYASGELPPKENEVWFKKSKKTGLLFGIYGTLMKLMLSQPQDVMKLIMSYTVFAEDSKMSAAKIKEFKKTIEAPSSGDAQVINEISYYLYRDSKKIVQQYLPDEVKHYIKRDVKRPGPYLVEGRFKNQNHKTNIHKDALDMLHQPNILNTIIKMPWINDVFNFQFGDPSNDQWGVINWCPTIVGNINNINEPGLKDRIVTDFYKPFEHLTLPLGKRLYDIVKHLPWDTTYHESKGYETIQEALRMGKTCYCYDLSKATDRFPVIWQEWVLKSLDLGTNYREQLELLRVFIKQHVKLPDGSLSKWAVGQPMGAFPSFAMFTLTHGMVLMQYLYSKGEVYDGQFVVHGDDIVIMDDELAEYYTTVIDYSGTPRNDFKSIVSNKVAEYNSRLITADGFILMRKYRPVTLDSLCDHVQYWGPNCINWLPMGKQKKSRLLKILSIPYVLSNGGSINPYGKTAVQRIMDIPLSVLTLIYTKDLRAKKYCSTRQLVLSHLRANKRFYENGSMVFTPDRQQNSNSYLLNADDTPKEMMVYGDHMLQQHLGYLEIADTLDREILEDTSNFIEFFNMSKVDNYALASVIKDVDEADLLIAQAQFDIFGNMAKAWNESFSEDYNYMISYNGIRTYDYNGQQPYGAVSTSKLRKALKQYKRVDYISA